MEYQKLGLTDLKISRIGFGCWAIGGHGYGEVDDRQSIFAIDKAVDLGINFFDTADVYGFGHSERMLSKALGAKRHDVVIATKGGVKWNANGETALDCSPQRIASAIDASLRRLRLDTIPLYQIHWHDKVTPIQEVLAVLKRHQEEGKIRHIGLCNSAAALLMDVADAWEVQSIQVPYNIANATIEDGIARYVNERRASLLVYNVLMRGLLTGKYSPGAVFGESDTRAADATFSPSRMRDHQELISELSRIGRLSNRTPSQVAIRWVLNSNLVTCALLGIKTAAQVEENADVFEWNLVETPNVRERTHRGVPHIQRSRGSA